MTWLRALLLLLLACGLALPARALAAQAPPAPAEVEQAELPPAILLRGELVSPSLQARLLRPRPLKPVAALAAGVGLGLVGGVVGVAVGAPFLLVGLPVLAFTGTLGGALGVTTGVWLYSGDAPFWWLGVGALVGMTVASVMQVGLLMVSLVAAVTLIGIPLAILLVTAAVVVGLLAMPLGASLAARIHERRPVPRLLFKDQDAYARSADPWREGLWQEPLWQEQLWVSPEGQAAG